MATTAEEWRAYRDVLEAADVETADLIMQIQLQDMAAVQLIACVACTERKPSDRTLHMPCNHDYCSECLETLYRDCMTDETLYPPRCCQQPFPYDGLKHLLSDDLQRLFREKRVELETTDRTYCHLPTCSAFINPATFVDGDAPCSRCHEHTCTECRKALHQGACGEDEHLGALMETASRNQWQRCCGCRRIIELNTGCYHITCICRSQFCYVCGMAWKNCPCPQWDERRLFERAARYVDNGQAQQLQRAADHLRNNHQCDHGRCHKLRNDGQQ